MERPQHGVEMTKRIRCECGKPLNENERRGNWKCIPCTVRSEYQRIETDPTVNNTIQAAQVVARRFPELGSRR